MSSPTPPGSPTSPKSPPAKQTATVAQSAPAAPTASSTAQPAQSKPGLTDAEISARSTKYAAWVAAGAAILAAALALWGTWWSADASDRAARTAADAAVKAVSIQLSGETEKSRAEFLRDQRRILYSTIIADEIKLREAEQKRDHDIVNSAGSRALPVPVRIKPMSPVAKQLSKLNQDKPSAEIIASPPVRARLATLYEVHQNIVTILTFMSTRGSKSDSDYARLLQLEGEREKAVDAFCQAARSDMGSE
jgi:hypothetical protein